MGKSKEAKARAALALKQKRHRLKAEAEAKAQLDATAKIACEDCRKHIAAVHAGLEDWRVLKATVEAQNRLIERPFFD